MSNLRGFSDVVISGADKLAWGRPSSASVDRHAGKEFSETGGLTWGRFSPVPVDRRAGEEFPSSVGYANSNRPVLAGRTGDINAYW